MNKYVFLFVIGLAVMGCSSKGFHREALREQLAVSPKVHHVSDREIQAVLEKRAQLPKNLKLAVYFKPPQDDHGRKWRWTEKDKKEFFKAFRMRR